MKKLFILALTICTIAAAGCSDKAAVESAENLSDNSVAVEEVSASVLDGEVFDKLPDEAIDSFNFVADKAKDIFPEAEGEWMYGYKGVQNIGKTPCYVFVVYTYADKTHVKEGTIAKSRNSDELFVLDEVSGEYTSVSLAQEENTSWANTQTLAFAKLSDAK